MTPPSSAPLGGSRDVPLAGALGARYRARIPTAARPRSRTGRRRRRLADGVGGGVCHERLALRRIGRLRARDRRSPAPPRASRSPLHCHPRRRSSRSPSRRHASPSSAAPAYAATVVPRRLDQPVVARRDRSRSPPTTTPSPVLQPRRAPRPSDAVPRLRRRRSYRHGGTDDQLDHPAVDASPHAAGTNRPAADTPARPHRHRPPSAPTRRRTHACVVVRRRELWLIAQRRTDPQHGHEPRRRSGRRYWQR